MREEERTRGRRRGPGKSIPQVNLRLEILYTINKQGESGGGMRERRGKQWQDTELSCRGHPQACKLR